MSKLTCRECGLPEHTGECRPNQAQVSEVEYGKLQARIKDLESINESHRKLNGELREQIKKLEEEAEINDAVINNFIAKLQKIIDKKG